MTDRPEERPSSDKRPLAVPQKTITSAEIFQGQREVLILHHGEVYRLRLTRKGKLILNK
jgi:hemin uptake protein HemP